MLKKWVIALMLLLAIPFPYSSTEAKENDCSNSINIKTESYADEKSIQIEYPILSGLKDGAFQDQLNHKIKKEINQKIDQLREEEKITPNGKHHLFVDYKLIKEGCFYSLLIRESFSNGNQFGEDIHSYNFVDESGATLIQLDDFVDNVNKLNEKVIGKMSSAPNKYLQGNESFKAIRPDLAYYVKEGHVTLVFNKYEVATGEHGTPQITIPLREISTILRKEIL
ncbi:DUF3298 domain-containing protein [Bacillaceae bacterium S4-13-58]